MLRDYREEIEREQRLPKALVEQLRAAGFYRMVIPRALGGLEVDPLTYLRAVELLAEGAGSVGWNLGNGGVGQLVTLGLPDEGVARNLREARRHDHRRHRGAGRRAGGAGRRAATGSPAAGSSAAAARRPAGCSGASRCSAMTASRAGTRKAARSTGAACLRAPKRRSCRGAGTSPGLRGTGSFDWTVEDVFLPERRTMPQVGIPLENQWSRWPGVTYQLPVQCWVGPHHSAVITGIARAGIDALIELAGGKQPRGRPAGLLCDNPQVQDAVGRADAILNAGRAYRSAMIAELWNTVASGRETTLEQRARCRLAAVYAADCAREAMDLMYRHGGSTSFKRESRLAECWRDLHTVGQTVTLAPEWYPIGGRVYLGLDPGPRLR